MLPEHFMFMFYKTDTLVLYNSKSGLHNYIFFENFALQKPFAVFARGSVFARIAVISRRTVLFLIAPMLKFFLVMF